MEKDQIVILEDRGLISIEGIDARNFLQNIISNDIDLVNSSNSIFAGIFTPQGKYLYEFFVIKNVDGYLLECDIKLINEIIDYFLKYKLKSKVEIKNLSSIHAVGVISQKKFKEIQSNSKLSSSTILYGENICFLDPRLNILGARIIFDLEKLHLTIKKLNLKIINKVNYLNLAHTNGIPIEGTKNLQNALFSLESNFEELNGISFKKGCYIGQENTARMKLRNKITKRLVPINFKKNLLRLSEISFENKTVGKIIISNPYPFALIKIIDPDLNSFRDKQLKINDENIKITIPNWINL